MHELATETDTRRRPWIAVLLSVIYEGLGHVYCGRIVKGLVLLFVGGVLSPMGLLLLLFGQSTSRAVGIVIFLAANAVWVYAIIDAYLTAKRTRPDYELKDYNRWYVYLLLVLLMLPSSLGCSLLFRADIVGAFRLAGKPCFRISCRATGCWRTSVPIVRILLKEEISWRSSTPTTGAAAWYEGSSRFPATR